MAGSDGPSRPRRPQAPGTGGARISAGGRRTRSNGHGTQRRSIFWRLRRVFFLLALAGLASGVGFATVIARVELPDPEELLQSSFICAAGVAPGECDDGTALARLSGEEDRSNVELQDVPQHLIDAVVATEDRQFFEHQGIDPVSIGRALYEDLRGRAIEQGGSTITQQYAKNLYLSHDRTLARKLEEAVLSVKLEQQMSKQEILEGYLNTVYFGRNAYGIQSASRAYFDKDVGDLGLWEAAFLAGLIRAPSVADPVENPEEATNRRATVLAAMVEEGYITQDQADLSNALEWIPGETVVGSDTYRLVETREGTNIGSEYVTAYVQRVLKEDLGFSDSEIAGGGLRVYTTLDMRLQYAAYETVYNPETGVLNQPDDPSAALVAVDENGHIKAMVGGRNFAERQVNLAVSGSGGDGRPVGSTFKAIPLALTVQDGYSLERSGFNAPATTVLDQTIDGQPRPGCADEWPVANYAESEQGYLNIVDATRVSSNTAYAQLMLELGPQNVLTMGQRLGMDTTDLEPCPPVVLGAGNSNPLEMAEIYSTFANRGIHKEPTIITRVEQVDQDGNAHVVWEWQPEETRVMLEEKADVVTHVLRQVIEGGTGESADIGKAAAGKTGTAQYNKDAWFVGYVPRLTTAVWMGYPEADWQPPQPCDPEDWEPFGCDLQIPPMNPDGRAVRGRSVTGGSFPAEIWRNFMTVATDMLALNDEFVEPPDDAMRDGETLGIPATTTTAPPPRRLPGATIIIPGDDDDDDDDDRGPPDKTQPTLPPHWTNPDSDPGPGFTIPLG